MKRRRSVSVFGMSFLDVMFCGFGAVILLVMLINRQTVAERETVYEDLRGEVGRLERELGESERHADSLARRLAASEEALEETRRQSERARTQASGVGDALAALEAASQARQESVEQLKADLKTLDSRSQRLAAEASARDGAGTRVRRFLGQGDRQYVTGLKMGGERVLILLDASASMLDRTIVNIIRRRNMPDAEKRRAAKWRRAVATVDWLMSQLPPSSSLQIYAFDTEAVVLLEGSDGRWVKARDGSSMNAMAAALRARVPKGGTSLHAAFDVVRRLDPPPDNVMLITDGLPTQGATPPALGTVSAGERLAHFQSAVATLPARIPINTILFPMEGDPVAAAAFWKLAGVTRGSLISPSRDWP